MILKILSVLVVLLLLGLWLQTFWHLFPESQLHGVTLNAPKPDFSVALWFNGNFQVMFEDWFSENIGFRSFWIRTYNQLNFSIFRQVSSSKIGADNVVLGKENWLYTREYLWAYSAPVPLSTQAGNKNVENLRELQEVLDRRNITLLTIISPNKATVYPEYVPWPYQTSSKEMTYNKVVPLLEEYGIRYIDGYKLFSAIKPDAPYPLFPKGGIHWNSYGAFLVFREIIKTLNPLLDKALPIPEYESVTLAPPRKPDNDLTDLINIWTPERIDAPCPYPRIIPQPLPPEKQPKILIVGDSFVWHLTNLFAEQKICSNIDLLYYYKRYFSYPDYEQNTVPFDPEKADWGALMLEKDIIILEINQAFLHNEIGFGFVEDALMVLIKGGLGNS